MNYCLILSYDGTAFSGWQAQGKEKLRTVQEVLQSAAKEIFHCDVKMTASGRTDAGVHAVCQPVSFSVETTIPAERMADCFNSLLPSDVKVVKSFSVADGFDACRSAKRKTYVYTFYLSSRENPLLERTSARVGGGFDFSLADECAKLLEGEHDFKAFCAANSSAKTTVRTVYFVKVEKEETIFGSLVRVYVCGNGFLYNMVRTMAGTIIDVAQGRKTLESVKKALDNGDRKCVGKTMEAKGLCLFNVEYQE